MINVSKRKILLSIIGITFLLWLVGVWWSQAPGNVDVRAITISRAQALEVEPVVGFATTTAVIEVAKILLEKPGGYLSNDIIPPSVFLDDMPAFEFGALQQIRDITLVLRNDFSRSQSQSVEDPDLVKSQPSFNFDSGRWILPSTESEYKKGIKHLEAYRLRLASPQSDAQFYARADNLTQWLEQVEKRLGSLSQRLSASVGQDRINTDLAGDSAAEQSTTMAQHQQVKTSWWQLDDVFYQARGASWALVYFLKAVEIDFNGVLEKKNALISLRQIIRELEQTQETLWSPMILNGSGFGMVANHSLVMANYISRANAGIIDLNKLLKQG